MSSGAIVSWRRGRWAGSAPRLALRCARGSVRDLFSSTASFLAIACSMSSSASCKLIGRQASPPLALGIETASLDLLQQMAKPVVLRTRLSFSRSACRRIALDSLHRKGAKRLDVVGQRIRQAKPCTKRNTNRADCGAISCTRFTSPQATARLADARSFEHARASNPEPSTSAPS